jgi:transcriptional repressor NrdR
MDCPLCGFDSTKVVDSRLTEPRDAVRRRRECEGCGQRFTTYERSESLPLVVVKRGGARERFDRQKLLRGLGRAASKRPVTDEQLDQVADSIVAAVGRLGGEATAEQVGDLAERGLARVDPVSAIQFASVYRNLADLDELEAVVRRYKSEELGPSDPRSSIGRSPQKGPKKRRDHVGHP